IPSMADMPEINPPLIPEGTENFQPYARDKKNLVRGWAIPGTKGLEHRVGGLEKDAITGSVSHDPLNHQKMVETREEKVNRIVKDVPDLEVDGDKSGELLIIGWGSTYGHLLTALRELKSEGKKIGLAHFRHIRPLPKNTREVLSRFKKLVVCELNLGQFAKYLRMNFQEFEFKQYNKIQGLPFTVIELKEYFIKILEEE
ncbi:MAG: 2-oxoacid:acceptor oxidoreductase subunit alpha, partial [Bacteroidetes bacterium]|nr:2-oxoacid:acceptor oxidoreductase subunit alpha [Bacteroidota bacterium]